MGPLYGLVWYQVQRNSPVDEMYKNEGTKKLTQKMLKNPINLCI